MIPDYTKIEEFVKAKLKPSRFIHSIGVMEMSVLLASRFGVDVEKAKVAGIYHDAYRYNSTPGSIELVEKNGYSVVREFQGHGIGESMHEDPGIPNYGKAGRGIRLEPGMTLAIEPMVIMGKPEILELEDGWTIITEDGSLAAHYENTILITENEPEILTLL